jgi:hypothetical protein
MTFFTKSKTTFVVSLLAAILLLALANGCGGGDESTASQPLTKAEFIAQFEKICKREDPVKEKRMTAASKLGENFIAAPPKELTRLVGDLVMPLYAELIEEMAALRPPVKDQAEIDRLIGKYERMLKKTEANPGEFVVNDTFLNINLEAEKYGIDNCSL